MFSQLWRLTQGFQLNGVWWHFREWKYSYQLKEKHIYQVTTRRMCVYSCNIYVVSSQYFGFFCKLCITLKYTTIPPGTVFAKAHAHCPQHWDHHGSEHCSSGLSLSCVLTDRLWQHNSNTFLQVCKVRTKLMIQLHLFQFRRNIFDSFLFHSILTYVNIFVGLQKNVDDSW